MVIVVVVEIQKQHLSMYRNLFLAIVLVLVLWWLLSRRKRTPSGFTIKDITDNLPKHPTKEFAKRSLSQIQEIVIHHTATDSVATSIESIAHYHVSPNNHICDDGCPGISYHFMINHKGEIYQTNQLETISYQCGGCNTTTIGVCLIGNFDNEIPTQKALTATHETIRYINQRLGRNLIVSGHRDHKTTSCPGTNINIDTIIQNVYA